MVKFKEGKGMVWLARRRPGVYLLTFLYDEAIIVSADVAAEHSIRYVEIAIWIIKDVADLHGEGYAIAQLRDQVIGHLQTLQNISGGV